MNKRISDKIFYYILNFTITIFVFASINAYGFQKDILANKLRQWFFMGLSHTHFFSLFDILIWILIFYVFFRFDISYKNSTKFSRILFLLTLLITILKLINPNNSSSNPIFGLPLFSDINIYTYLILMYIICFIKSDDFINLINIILRIFFKLLFLRIIIYYILYFGGMNLFTRLGDKSILMEQDTLFIISFTSSFYLAKYLITHTKKYAIYFFLFSIFLFLSLRRNPVFVFVITNFILLFWFYLYKFYIIKRFFILLSFIVIIIFLLGFGIFNKIGMNQNFKVYSTIISDARNFPFEYNHFTQTIQTFESASNLKFWGKGYGDLHHLGGAYLDFQIHNVYAYLWTNYGIYMIIYYLFIIMYMILQIFKAFFQASIKNYELVRLLFSSYYLLYMIGMSFIVIQYLEETKMFVFLSLILGVLIHLKKNNYSALIGGIKHESEY